jgi:hypothetical protein
MEFLIALWMPTKDTHREQPTLLSGVRPPKPDHNISDDPGYPVWVRISLRPADERIAITRLDNRYPHCPIRGVTPIVMTVQKRCSDGFILYKCEEPVSDKVRSLFNRSRGRSLEFPYAIYHVIKGYYHEHKYHHKEQDALLTPYVNPGHSVTPDDIEATHKKAIEHYLQCYVTKFTNNVDSLTEQFETIKTQRRPNVKFYNDIDKRTKNMRGEKDYCTALLRSEYVDTTARAEITSKVDKSFSRLDRLNENVERDFERKQKISSYRIAILSLWIAIASLAITIIGLIGNRG